MGGLGRPDEGKDAKGNYRIGDEGPSDPYADLWQDIWEEYLEKEHKKNFYSK